MKKLSMMFVALILVLSMILGTAALACDEYGSFPIYGCDTVYASGGSSYIRDQPSLNGRILGSLSRGNYARYCGESCYDYRGVRWDFVCSYGVYGWVSSRYTTLY